MPEYCKGNAVKSWYKQVRMTIEDKSEQHAETCIQRRQIPACHPSDQRPTYSTTANSEIVPSNQSSRGGSRQNSPDLISGPIASTGYKCCCLKAFLGALGELETKLSPDGPGLPGRELPRNFIMTLGSRFGIRVTSLRLPVVERGLHLHVAQQLLKHQRGTSVVA